VNIETAKAIKENAPVLAGIAILCVIETLAAFVFFDLVKRSSPASKDLLRLSATIVVLTGSLVGIGTLLGLHVYRLQKRYRWLINEINIRFASLGNAINGLQETPQPEPNREDRWPWGSHHTDLLGHLEAAGKQWWVRYDPTDPSTAPTNEMVAEWLRFERNVSREKAQAIASILRADGLRTGPR
jgi:hypothetical protein